MTELEGFHGHKMGQMWADGFHGDGISPGIEIVTWIDWAEQWIRIAGAAAALLTLGVLLAGIARGLRNPKGARLGAPERWLRGPTLVMIAIGYFAAAVLLWKPLPLTLSPCWQLSCLFAGTILVSTGLAAILWARLTLGSMYNISSSTSVELYAGHRLVSSGPYAIVRHPMYLGLALAGMGGMLLYLTWGMLFLLITFLVIALRAKREESILAAEFAEQWQDYCRRVPAFFPRLKGRDHASNQRSPE